MKHIIKLSFVLLIGMMACSKQNNITPSSATNSSQAYTWGTLVQLQGHYRYTQPDGANIGGYFDPNPDGTIGIWREVMTSVMENGSGGEYKFDTKRLSFSGIATSYDYLNGDWQINTYNADYSIMTATKIGTSTKINITR